MLKTKFKFVIIVLGFFVALCLFNTNTVNAIQDNTVREWNVILPNEIEKDLIFGSLDWANNSGVMLELDPFELVSVLLLLK